MTSLRALVDKAAGFAEAMFDPDEMMIPHFLAEAADGGLTVMALALSGRDLDRTRRLAEVKFKLQGFRRWVFFSEAWSAEYRTGDRAVQPVDHPERIEVVLFDGFDVAGQRRLRATRQILRTKGTAIRLMPLVVVSGRVTDAPSVAIAQGGRP